MQELLDNGKILFGKDESKIIELKVYAKEYQDKLSSVYELDGRLGAYDMKALFPEAKQLFKSPKPVQLLQYLLSFVLNDGDVFVDFFSGSGTSAEAVLRMIARGKKLSFMQIQIKERTKENSEAQILEYTTIDQIGIERIIRAAQKIREEYPDTTADLGFLHYTLMEPSNETLDKLEKFSPEDSGMYITNTVLENFGLSTVLTTWLVRDGYGFAAPVKAIDFAGYTGYYMDKHLYLIGQGLGDKVITAIIEKFETDGTFNPENVVLFGYSFKWTELEALKTNLSRLKDTEKNLRINLDIRY
jgi:type III restriction enzyme/adenine-specific DNA-methyltransferase